MRSRKILFLVSDLSDNALGRTHALWLLARACGYDAAVLGSMTSSYWPVLSGSEFQASCTTAPADRSAWEPVLLDRFAWADLVIACKPVMNSFGRAVWAAARHPIRLMLDIDDPDLHAYGHSGRNLPARARYRVRTVENPLLNAGLRAAARLVPRIVSNPTLQQQYGGTCIPHPRPMLQLGAPHRASRPLVAFIGTPKPHKGIDILRDAVHRLADEGFRLVITADPPADSQPWESWIGTGSLDRGMTALSSADIVALPSLQDSWSHGQLPMKLLDAMLLGRACVVSNVDPMPWAVGNTGLVIEQITVTRLVRALQELANPAARSKLGKQARSRALSQFTVDALAPRFSSLVEETIARRSVMGWPREGAIPRRRRPTPL